MLTVLLWIVSIVIATVYAAFTLWVALGTYKFLHTEYAGAFPFDRPVWVYRLGHWWKRVRRRWARRRSLIWHCTQWWNERANDVGGLVIIILVIVLLWAGLIITAP